MTSSTCSTHHFPSFSEGLSLRPPRSKCSPAATPPFPFLFGRAFIEAVCRRVSRRCYLHFPSFSEGLSLRLPSRKAHRATDWGDFPSFSEGLSLRLLLAHFCAGVLGFPFLFGRAFIEAISGDVDSAPIWQNFPSFSEGLSLRLAMSRSWRRFVEYFPSFSEGLSLRRFSTGAVTPRACAFPFLFGRAFIEAQSTISPCACCFGHFPSFSEGLSLRRALVSSSSHQVWISLPFRKGFH